MEKLQSFHQSSPPPLLFQAFGFGILQRLISPGKAQDLKFFIDKESQPIQPSTEVNEKEGFLVLLLGFGHIDYSSPISPIGKEAHRLLVCLPEDTARGIVVLIAGMGLQQVILRLYLPFQNLRNEPNIVLHMGILLFLFNCSYILKHV
ncbi:unnamed protein product [Linum tenue]|uniref:Uncharacterized protein n=1 Tax=Linum tenue TaxID=586396 RepID=A0AAV0NFH8_9ROSI|nr:unnamed protein product [Linum tenue]